MEGASKQVSKQAAVPAVPATKSLGDPLASLHLKNKPPDKCHASRPHSPSNPPFET